MSEPKTRRVAVRGVVFHEGKLLCVRLKPYNVQKREYFWCTPGGGLDPGESLEDGIRREMVEETGVEPKIGALLYVQQYQTDDLEYLEFLYHITNPEDYLSIDLSKTTHGEIEIEELDFVDPAKTYILPKFLSTQDIAADIKAGVTQVFNLL